jgi:hypothetical protein
MTSGTRRSAARRAARAAELDMRQSKRRSDPDSEVEFLYVKSLVTMPRVDRVGAGRHRDERTSWWREALVGRRLV